ncbi:MAG TPA: flippase, partial [Vitreimonas sp.]|nr:flippase [Vitreimonas sp.]
MIARNALLNLGGHAAPLLAAVFFVPPLVMHLGVERFGFLALAWALVGYFSLLDLGFGRALSWLVAERRGTPREAGLARLSRTALSLTLALGLAAGVALFALAGPVCETLLKDSPGLLHEAQGALRVLAWVLPFVTVTGTLRGLLEAGQRFDWVNAIRVPLGVLTFAAPLAATLWSADLVAMAIALGVVRIAAFAAHWAVSARLYPALVGFRLPLGSAAGEMFRYGAWLTVSNVVGPLMVYIDRFVIGAVLAVAAVAYYSAPYEVVTRLWLVPAAVTGVLFPAMVAATPARLGALYRTGSKAVLLAIFPLVLFATLFAAEWLRLWLGPDFAAHGTRAAQLLCLGAAINCLAYLPLTLLQARGRTDLPAKAHLAELPIYLVLLWILVGSWGIEGAALAWALRCAADAAVLFSLARRAVPEAPLAFTAAQLATIGLAALSLAGAVLPLSPGEKLAYVVGALAVCGGLGW